ncbi:hypothetical protein Tco_1371627 [Tanacetum coccineum]
MVTESLEHVVLAMESSQPQSSYEAAATLIKFELKKILINKMDKNKDKDEDPSTGSDQGLKKRKTSKDAELTKGPKAKESQSGSSKDSNMPQDQEENPGNDVEEPKEKTLQHEQSQSWLMTLASSADKPSKTFDELMSTPIDFSAFIMNDLKSLKITNLT